MKTIKSVLAASLIFGAAALPVSAQEYMFTYSKFYSQLKNNAKEGHDDVKIGFFFVDSELKQPCNIEKAWMEKEEHYEEFVIPSNNELPFPLDNNLKSANPLVFVHTPADQQCDYSMVVMTKEPLSEKVSYQQVEALIPQMQTMLNDLGGMFASWFTPDIEGLTLEFPNQLNGRIVISDGSVIEVEQGKAALLLSQIPQDGYIRLPAETQRVMPFIPQKN
ncbi:DUF2987 domain-containing protein [Vibrio maerlii]|uniref:DUF2987 domain-containing protein n=1 Tax=Vibrio maerlii TaxID=2231648 RepID=UPI000E3D63ED|nr:DUF2987 domain-containing protein [Vibrio maerlii]